MVHIYCLNENCRHVIHLDSEEHWNFKGNLTCSRCGAETEVEIENGQLKSSKKSQGK